MRVMKAQIVSETTQHSGLSSRKGARLDGKPCGAVVCSLIGTDLNIVSLYVASALRRNGIGSGLLEYACAMAFGEADKTGDYQQLRMTWGRFFLSVL